MSLNKPNIFWFAKTGCFVLNKLELQSQAPRMQPEQARTNKTWACLWMLLLLLVLTCSISNSTITVSEYPYADDFFDKVYVLDNGSSQHYLRLYCKQPNMLSVSITRELEFEEFPRFPIYSKSHTAPKMQRKGYTFLRSCPFTYAMQRDGDLIRITRNGTSQAVFTIKSYAFKSDDLIEIETEDKSTKWGMGERFQTHFAIKDGVWTVWNRDRPWEIDYGQPQRSAQTYGHQPVYLAHENGTNKFHLIYFKNTHGFNFQSSEQSSKMKYFVTGGHVQFIILVGRSPENILKQYHSYIGASSLPPFWSLGYHQSRWGYRNLQEFTSVVNEFEKLKLPLDTMWSDLDYMNNKAIFTVDSNNYPPSELRGLMKSKNIHYVPLIDVGVSIADQNAKNMGKKLDVFFKSVRNPAQDYVGAVWPGKVHFVDYLHPNASEFWGLQLDRLYKEIPFSGVWLDMNEPSNFQGNQFVQESYRIQHSESINMMTIDVNLKHHSTEDRELSLHQTHAYYGHLSTLPTYEFLTRKNGRSFIISRSNSVGSGAYAGHWTGDNVATWEFLRLSISGNFLFQIFGIHMVGADICGFHQNTNQQLCSRWMQVGSFYPFARNHNENESIPQEPYRFGDKLIQTTRLSFYQRYSLLKQMYTSMLSLNGTGSFYRPLFFEFPQDPTCFTEEFVETQFMIGDYLLGAPIVQQGQVERSVYFPKGDEPDMYWVELSVDKDQGVRLDPDDLVYKQAGSTEKIKNELPSAPPIYLRSGRMVFTSKPATRTSQITNSFLLVAPLLQKQAKGSLLAAPDFGSNEQIDQCVAKGCTLEFSLQKDDSGSYTLAWEQKGQAQLQISIELQKIQVVEDFKVVSFKGFTIKSKAGRKILE